MNKGKYYKSQLFPDLDIFVAKDTAQLQAIRPGWDQMQRKEAFPVPGTDPNRYLSVIQATGDDVCPYIMLAKQNSSPVAMVVGRVERHPVRFQLGYKTLLSPKLRCLTVIYGGLLGNLTDDLCAMLIRELKDTLVKGRADVVLFNHLRTDSPMYQLATTRPSFMCRGHLSKIEVHRSMSVPDSIDSFYKSRSKKHRANLRRYIRKLGAEYPGQVRTLSYRQPEEIGEFITAASQISTQTYQQTLGSGFHDDEQTRKLIKTAARRGWLLGHALYLGDEPCAFQLGLLYQKTYFLEQIGYSPRWGKYNVGTVLFLNVLRELCEGGKTETIDFGFGDAEYKRSYGDKDWLEASVYIFAPRLYPIFVNILRSSMMGLSSGLEYALNKIGLVDRVKRRWRDRLQQKNNQ